MSELDALAILFVFIAGINLGFGFAKELYKEIKK